MEGIDGSGACSCDAQAGYGGTSCDKCLAEWYGNPTRLDQPCDRCPYAKDKGEEVCGGETRGACTLLDADTDLHKCTCTADVNTGMWTGPACDVCVAGWAGSNCTVPCPDLCGGGNGNCTAIDGSSSPPVCTCEHNWQGGNGACTECTFGYYGLMCELCPVPPWYSQHLRDLMGDSEQAAAAEPVACSNFECGRCDDGVMGNGSCVCFPGHEGADCGMCSSEYYDKSDDASGVCVACPMSSKNEEVCSGHAKLDPTTQSLCPTGRCNCADGWESATPDFICEMKTGPTLSADWKLYVGVGCAGAAILVLVLYKVYRVVMKRRRKRKAEIRKLDILSERLLARNPQLQGLEQAFRMMTSDAADWLINFEDIELGAVVGSGTSAHVFKSWYCDQVVAVKRLHSVRWDAKEFEAFFTQEAGLIAKLHHPNVVRFYGVCYQDDHFYIVTEFCHENLSQALRRLKQELKGPLPEEVFLNLAYQIAKGMAYLHSKDVIHRDLKPENILLDDRGDVKLCDFGLSRIIVGSDIDMTQQVGTPAYMAPEMAGVSGDETFDADGAGMGGGGAVPRPTATIGKPADVYSYGILLWTLWSQALPYSDLRIKNPFQLMVMVTGGFRPPVPKDMPFALATLMQNCWAADPLKRPTMLFIVDTLRSEMQNRGVNKSMSDSEKQDLSRSPSGAQSARSKSSPLISPQVRARNNSSHSHFTMLNNMAGDTP